MRRNRHGSVGVPKIAPDAHRPLGIEVYHYRAAARELVRDDEADCDGGFPSAALLRHQRYGQHGSHHVSMLPRSCNATMLAC